MEDKETNIRNKKVLTKAEKIGTVIFISWFIISFFLTIITFNLEMYHLGFFLAGQYFIVFGCIFFYSKDASGFIAFVMGLGLIIGSIIAKNYERLRIISSDFSLNDILTIIFTLLFLLFSVIFLIVHLINKKTNKYFYIFLALLIIFILLALYLCF